MARSSSKPPDKGAAEIVPPAQPDKAAGGVSLTALSMEYAGPLPPPAYLAAYEQIAPGAAQRILAMAEEQAKHRREIESKVIGSDTGRSWAGLFIGGILSLAILASGTWVILAGHDTAGTTIITGTLVALAGVFVYATQARRSERETKAATMAAVTPKPK